MADVPSNKLVKRPDDALRQEGGRGAGAADAPRRQPRGRGAAHVRARRSQGAGALAGALQGAAGGVVRRGGGDRRRRDRHVRRAARRSRHRRRRGVRGLLRLAPAARRACCTRRRCSWCTISSTRPRRSCARCWRRGAAPSTCAALAEQNLGAVYNRRGNFEEALAHQRAAMTLYARAQRQVADARRWSSTPRSSRS